MRGRAARRQRGQELVEFALVAPIMFFLLIGGMDLMRVVQVTGTAADAARQGARQAVANAVTGDTPFGTPNGQPCSGTTLTGSATGTGCLTDAAIKTTVDRVLGSTVSGSTLHTSAPSACPAPAAGAASLCVYPDQATRSGEWTGLAQQGSFMVSVTVVVRYRAMTPVVAGVFPAALLLTSVTSMLAEY